MKKFRLYAVITIFLCLSALVSISVSAETLLVKNMWILKENCIVVLRENGDLLLGNSIDTQTPKLLAQNVKEFKGIYERDSFIGFALHNNGDITKISCQQYDTEKEELKNETVNANAEKLYTIGGMAYLNKNHELKFSYSDGVNYPFDVTLDKIKKGFNARTTFDPIYAISTDDVLYQYKIDGYSQKIEKTEIITNVKDCMLSNGDLIVLRNNNDLYFIKDTNNTPERIGTNIESLEKVDFYSTWTDSYPIDYVNKDGEYFSGTANDVPIKYMDNVKNVYIVGDHRYVLTKDNILYSFGPYHWGINPEKSSTTKYFDVSNVFLTGDSSLKWKQGTDGALYRDDMIYYMSDVADVIKYERSNKDDLYLFLKQNGELWGAFGDTPNAPFLTAFCQKRTIVKINYKEIELTAKIQMVNDRSMYPFRECLENMGATVLWDAVNQIAIGEYNGLTVEFPIGKNEYYVNGVRHEMDTTSYIDDSINRTYIPIRYAAEGLGFTVEWVEGDLENTINIHK